MGGLYGGKGGERLFGATQDNQKKLCLISKSQNEKVNWTINLNSQESENSNGYIITHTLNIREQLASHISEQKYHLFLKSDDILTGF
jgi:hypothetical protein